MEREKISNIKKLSVMTSIGLAIKKCLIIDEELLSRVNRVKLYYTVMILVIERRISELMWVRMQSRDIDVIIKIDEKISKLHTELTEIKEKDEKINPLGSVKEISEDIQPVRLCDESI